jgi:hypothetical protein
MIFGEIGSGWKALLPSATYFRGAKIYSRTENFSHRGIYFGAHGKTLHAIDCKI